MSEPTDPVYTEKERRKEDLKFLQQRLEEVHVDLYRNVTKDEFTEALNRAAELPSHNFPIGIQEALALLGDAHTKVPEVIEVWDDRLPFNIKEIDRHYYIIGTNDANIALQHQEILQINGHKLQVVIDALSKLSSKENSERHISDNERLLLSLSALSYYGFVGDNSIRLKTYGGEFEVTDFEGNVGYLNPLNWDNHDVEYYGNPTYRFRTIGNTVLFQYNACNNRRRTAQELKSFKDRLLREAETSKGLVVDLRLNSGGDTRIMSDLFESLPNHLKIYVANSRRTFSSAMHHMLYLKRQRGAVLIGENAGQRPNRFGYAKKISLPNSKLMISCSCDYFELLPGQDIDVIKPDIHIPVTIEHYRTKTDPLLEWIEKELG